MEPLFETEISSYIILAMSYQNIGDASHLLKDIGYSREETKLVGKERFKGVEEAKI